MTQNMACSKGKIVWSFKIILVIKVILVVSVMIGINVSFNMVDSSGYLKVLGVVSPLVERLKNVGENPVVTGNMSNSELKWQRTLVNPAELRMETYASSNDKKKEVRQRKNILWFNKPVWINIYTANSILSTKCAYDNCRMSENRQDLQNYSAIVYTITAPLEIGSPIPPSERRPDQVWIFFGLESPVHTSRMWYRHNSWKNTMNWSMSYRLDSDLYYPYGILVEREKPLTRDYSAIYRQKTKQVAWAVSNCGAPSRRDEYVAEMKATPLQVDIYGRCTEGVFSGQSDIKEKVSPYLFYLSFENSLCVDYITEKFFRYFEWDVVLVVRGGADYDRLLPNDTFIDASKFSSAAKLAEFLLHVAQSESLYTQFLRNKDKYRVVQYPGEQTTWCNICERLNNLAENRKSYSDHVTYIHQGMCRDAEDISGIPHHYLLVIVISAIIVVIILLFFIVRKVRNKSLPT